MTTRARLFIGSSTEQLTLANAIQESLQHDFDTTVWNQDVIRASTYPLESLEHQLRKSDAGVFVLAPDDFIRIRKHNYHSPRDNVVFELGMFVGRLGRLKSFVVVPFGYEKLRLPTDLVGLTPLSYESDRADGNMVAALGPACNQIRKALRALFEQGELSTESTIEWRLFHEFSSEFPGLIQTSNELWTCFIHSRRWRENNHDHIIHFLARDSTRMRVFLPDLDELDVIVQVADHFEDAKAVPGLIADAYRYYAELANRHPKKITFALFRRYPTYSFYIFDKLIVFALYPNSTIKKGVPTFKAELIGKLEEFFRIDIERLTLESTIVTPDELLARAGRFSLRHS